MADNDDNASHLTVRAEQDAPGGPVLHVGGELDLATAPKLSAAAKEVATPGTDRVVFDLARLTFMDSSGLRVLLEVANEVGKVTVRNASATARRVIESTGVDSVLDLE